jgi:hypothetical protein
MTFAREYYTNDSFPGVRFEFIHSAAGEKPGTLNFCMPHSVGVRMHAAETARVVASASECVGVTKAVPVMSLDSYFPSSSSAASSGVIDLLMTDAEQHDYFVARGASKLFTEGRVRVYVFEMGGKNFEAHLAWMESMHYFCFFILNKHAGHTLTRKFHCVSGACRRGDFADRHTAGWMNGACVHRKEAAILTWMLEQADPYRPATSSVPTSG